MRRVQQLPSVIWMPLIMSTFNLAGVLVVLAGGMADANGEVAVTELVAGRSGSESVFVGLSVISRSCTGFGARRDDWVMELMGDTLVVRYGDESSLEDLDGCAFGPLVVPQWPSIQVALSAEKFIGEVSADVSSVRLEFARRSCDEPASGSCNPIVVREVLAETTIQDLPRDAARLEAGAWRQDPGVGVFGRPGPSLQLREDGTGLALVWIGGRTEGGADWVFAGGQLSNAAATLQAYVPVSGGCPSCLVPDMEMELLDDSLDVWIRGATEVWISLPGTSGLPMSPWRPWSIRQEIRFTWLDGESFPALGDVAREAHMADLAGEWLDVDRQFAVTDGRLLFSARDGDIRFVGWDVSWDGGSGSLLCGPEGNCLLVDNATGRELRFRISAVGAERIYSPQVPCRSASTCDGIDGGLFLVRGGG